MEDRHVLPPATFCSASPHRTRTARLYRQPSPSLRFSTCCCSAPAATTPGTRTQSHRLQHRGVRPPARRSRDSQSHISGPHLPDVRIRPAVKAWVRIKLTLCTHSPTASITTRSSAQQMVPPGPRYSVMCREPRGKLVRSRLHCDPLSAVTRPQTTSHLHLLANNSETLDP